MGEIFIYHNKAKITPGKNNLKVVKLSSGIHLITGGQHREDWVVQQYGVNQQGLPGGGGGPGNEDHLEQVVWDRLRVHIHH